MKKMFFVSLLISALFCQAQTDTLFARPEFIRANISKESDYIVTGRQLFNIGMVAMTVGFILPENKFEDGTIDHGKDYITALGAFVSLFGFAIMIDSGKFNHRNRKVQITGSSITYKF